MDAEHILGRILESFSLGELARGEVVELILAELNRDNIDDILRSIPETWKSELVAEMRQLSRVVSPDQLTTLEAGLFEWEGGLCGDDSSSDCLEALRAEHEGALRRRRERLWEITLPAIRWWLQTRDAG